MKKAGLLFIFLIISIFLAMNFVSAGQLKVTNNHPFLINNSWIPASDLKIGDLLTTYDGKKARITGIQDIEEENPFLVYNLEDSFFHNYVASGIIVHNSDYPLDIHKSEVYYWGQNNKNFISHTENVKKIVPKAAESLLQDTSADWWSPEEAAVAIQTVQVHDASKTRISFLIIDYLTSIYYKCFSSSLKSPSARQKMTSFITYLYKIFHSKDAYHHLPADAPVIGEINYKEVYTLHKMADAIEAKIIRSKATPQKAFEWYEQTPGMLDYDINTLGQDKSLKMFSKVKESILSLEIPQP